jgi:intracellular septation protein
MPIAFLKKHIPFKTILNVLIEFGPLIMFFVAFEIFKFMTAVAVLIGTVVIALIASIIVQRRVAWFPILSCGSVMLFGGLTLFLHNPNWIIFKDTLYFGLFGLAVVIQLFRGKLMLKTLFGSVFHVDDRV